MEDEIFTFHALAVAMHILATDSLLGVMDSEVVTFPHHSDLTGHTVQTAFVSPSPIYYGGTDLFILSTLPFTYFLLIIARL